MSDVDWVRMARKETTSRLSLIW